MSIKWKSRKGVRPQDILNRIESAKTLNPGGQISFSAFDFHDAYVSLLSMLDIPSYLERSLNIDAIFPRVLKEAARIGPLAAENLLIRLNEIVRSELSTPEVEWRLLTSISFKNATRFTFFNIDSARVSFVQQDYPSKYSSRNDISKHNHDISLHQPGYQKIIVYAKARNSFAAAVGSLHALDVVRAIMSLYSNNSMEFFGDPHAPINKIRLGQVHTLHRKSGKVLTDDFWFEPNFVEARPLRHSNPDAMRQRVGWCIDKLERCRYHAKLSDALVQYVRALDERDQNSAGIRLWSALEILTGSSFSNYDKIVTRCSFLFEEPGYHRQVLEHLRDFRNRNVHSPILTDRAKSCCYQMQFYFRSLLLFHLKSVGEFNTLQEANDFLDLPSEREALLAKKVQIAKALKFRQIEP